MKQEFLVEQIINALNLEAPMLNCKESPAVKPLLHKDEIFAKRKYDWHYRSVTGMLNYLKKTSRPEIAFAVHQCARFCKKPILFYNRALHRIVQYLAVAKDKGILFTPDEKVGVQCFVNADFSGGWQSCDTDNPAGVLSRTGYIITYGKLLLVWESKLQTEIALSTTNSEYISISQSMQEIIPLLGLLSEI